MADLFAGIFFPRSKTSDVICTEDIIGNACVRHLVKVRWHGRTYTAKEELSKKIELVSTDGELQSPVFSRCPVGADGSIFIRSEFPELRTDRELLENMNNSMKKMMIRIGRLESDAATRRLQVEASQHQQRFRSVLGEVKANTQEQLRRVPRNVDRGESFSYYYESHEFLERVRKLCGGNVNQFALDLEKEVYSDDTTELTVQVEKRVRSATKVDFIKECIYKYYLVPIGKAECVEGRKSGSKF